MIKIPTTLGKITLTSEFFTDLVGNLASSCYGVKGMVNSGAVDTIKRVVFGKESPTNGVLVRYTDRKLNIELHVRILYGVNVSAIAESVAGKVKYGVETVTGLPVGNVITFIDAMDAE